MEIIRELKPKGIIVIPKDVRESVHLRVGDQVSFRTEENKIIIEKKKKDIDAFFKVFFRHQKKGREFTLRELKKIEGESYDLP